MGDYGELSAACSPLEVCVSGSILNDIFVFYCIKCCVLLEITSLDIFIWAFGNIFESARC